MSTTSPPSRISMGAVSVDRGSPGADPDSASGAGVSKPYDRELFMAFLAATTRLFCDDEQIVVVDFLASEEKAFTERELIDRLGWPDKRVREVCASLERLMLIQKEQLSAASAQALSNASADGDTASSSVGGTTDYGRGSMPGGAALLGSGASSAAPFYYRVSPYAVIVVQYRIEQIDTKLKQQRREAETRDVFVCPICGRQYDALEAQRLKLDPEDATFLCDCGSKLEHEDSKTVVEHLASLQQRLQEQLQLLRSLISRCWSMRVPVFAPFTRAEKNELKKQQDKSSKTNAGSSVGSAVSCSSDNPASAVPTWRQAGPASEAKLQMSGTRQGQAEGTKSSVSTPSWMRSGSGASFSYGAAPAAASLPGHPPGAAAVASAAAQGADHSMQPKDNTAPPVNQPLSAAGGKRGQIKFSMKTSNKLSTLRGTPAYKPGVPAATAATAASATTANAAGKIYGETGAAAAQTAGAPAVVPSGQKTQPAALGLENKGHGRDETVPDREEASTLGAAERPFGGETAGAPEPGAGAAAEDITGAAAAEEAPRVYISRLGRDFTIEEAVEYQLDMSIEEHEKFMELQSTYLDDL
ncbi:Transcription initiation factor IIE alpha subunit, related [Eimeria necatrix]|uniref:Transcription initiation factor IIE alpha subunit, related n=1 Tax=Eimeria necatrix TaxID=51315 RepID=U6N4I0_9EIME|nr:Transcription initiation factor IIE alpha subunit, related [Eimeria necatrix]CDJ69610.1 Transcription initiation factor IIE alpha subunit, related [Eimeria necatrix]